MIKLSKHDQIVQNAERLLSRFGARRVSVARIFLRGDKYRPIKHARDIVCPVLLQICDKDTLVPIEAVMETAKILGDPAELKHYPIGHFDIYTGDAFNKSVSDQVAFFRTHL